MFEYWLYIISSLAILPAIIFAIVAQIRVQSAFSKYSAIPSANGITAAELAERLLAEHGCDHVKVASMTGHLNDHYDPRTKTVALSEKVYASTSLAALGIAAHEVGHAVQDHTKYPPLKLRQVVIKSTSLVNKILLPLIIIGFIASFFVAGATIMGIAGNDFFYYLILALCVLYGLSFLINVITLPTEYNASARAKKMLADGGYLADREESAAVSRVLSAAALTYVAALIISLAYFLRFLAIALSARRR